MLLKCCTQYTSKFEKLSSGHRTGKGQFSFQSQRRAIQKNVKTTIQLHSFHMLAKLCLKFYKLSFKSTWTKNCVVFKLDLEKADEPEIKLTTFVGSWRKQGSSRKNIYSCFIDYAKAFVWITKKLWKILKDENTRPPYLSLEKPAYGSRSNSYNQTWNNRLVQNWERSMSRLYIFTLFNFYPEYIM